MTILGGEPVGVRRGGRNVMPMPAEFLPEPEDDDAPPTPTADLGDTEDSGPEDTEDDAEPTGEATDHGESDGETEESAAQVPSDVEAWGPILVDAPQRIAELKGSQRAAAIAASHAHLTATHQAQTDQLVAQAAAQAREYGRIEAHAQMEFQRLKALDHYDREAEFDSDPRTGPQKRAAFHQLMAAELNPRESQPAQADQSAAYRERALRQFAAIEDQSIRAKLLTNERAGKYPATLDGYEALVADIAAERAKPKTPAAPPPEAAAAAKLKSGPKTTSTGGGSSTPGPLTVARYKSMTRKEMDAYMDRPGGEAELDAMLERIARGEK